MVLPKDGAHLPPAPSNMSGVPLDIKTLVVAGAFDQETTTVVGVFLQCMTQTPDGIPLVPVAAVFYEAADVDRLIDLLIKQRQNVWGKRGKP